MRKLFCLALGAMGYATITGLYELGVAYEVSGYGLHPVVCLWLGGALLVSMTFWVALDDRS